MKILVTGSKGFIGRNLVKILRRTENIEKIMEYNRENSLEELYEFCSEADAVFHLAAVLRPKDLSGFDENIRLTSILLKFLEDSMNKCPVMFASSIQANLDNPYGNCKRIEEAKFIDYGRKNAVNSYIFRFPNLFGTMSRPNYTSVIATFCYNTVLGLPITVNNPATRIKFAFVECAIKRVLNIIFNEVSEVANRVICPQDFYLVGLGELVYYMETLKNNTPPPSFEKR